MFRGQENFQRKSLIQREERRRDSGRILILNFIRKGRKSDRLWCRWWRRSARRRRLIHSTHPEIDHLAPLRIWLRSSRAARCSIRLHSRLRTQASSFFERSCSCSSAASNPSEGGGAGGVLAGRQGQAEVEGEEQAQLEGIKLLQIDATNLGPGKGSESVLLQVMCPVNGHTGKMENAKC